MRACLFLAVLATAALAGTRGEHQTWEFFKARHGKTYKSAEEEAARKKVFEANMVEARSLEARNPKAQFGASPFADLTTEEFKRWHNADQYYANRKQEQTAPSKAAPMWPKFAESEVAAVPTSMDWRTQGAVTPVKNQGQCGSCWSFSTTGGIEGQWKLAGNDLVSLSEQELVSCDKVDQACDGGLMNNAYDWILANRSGKLVTEMSYPYVSGDGIVPACDMSQKKVGATITGHYNIYHSESQMTAWVATHGPLSIAVDASAWQMYFGGVMTNCGGSRLDHGVLIVAYGVAPDGMKTWTIKNSWAASWGELGYIQVERGNDQCLLTHYPVTSTVEGSKPRPPTNPPAPVEAGYWVHQVYDNQNCSVGRWNVVWKQGSCLVWDGVSFKAECTPTEVKMTVYTKSLNCTGATSTYHESRDKCFTDNHDFAYATNRCPTTAPKEQAHPKALEQLTKKFKKAFVDVNGPKH